MRHMVSVTIYIKQHRHGYVSVKPYSQKQVMGRVWPMNQNLSTPNVESHKWKVTVMQTVRTNNKYNNIQIKSFESIKELGFLDKTNKPKPKEYQTSREKKH